MREPTKFPAPVEVHSNQYYARGFCHGVGVGEDGRPFALIEDEGGTVQVLRLDGCYSINFKDWRRT